MRQLYHLEKDHVQTLQLLAGDELMVQHGTVWLSEGGDDIVLERQQRYRLNVGGPVVIEALCDTELTVRHADTAGARHGWHDWLSRAMARLA
ncbi:DUF2917 domain-containing protein [Chitinimonas sp.]|uniref:DUF2917 domain-containing protein n=1 Tax=Chitinimonas sp. TaxID=1934313 RepID=UPI0035B1BDF3